MKNKTLIVQVLWIWVFCIFTAYIIQFLDFIVPVLNVMGFK